jgi:hypothetical protein
MSLTKYTPELKFLIILFFVFYPVSNILAVNKDITVQDTLKEDQTLYNGKIWRNIYYLIKEDQFLFSKEFLPGSVSVRGKLFTGILLKYDIYRDELITPVDKGVLLQLNKERIDSFSLSFQSKTYNFIKAEEDSVKGDQSFFNVLYEGNTALLVRYTKKIEKMAVEGKYDKFYQISRIYLNKGNGLFQVTGKKDLLKLMPEQKTAISEYMKINKIRVSEKSPETFIPVVRFYDSLKK